MFDFRYHALSLAAVLFALAVGILIGVAIGDSNLVSSAQNGIVKNLRAEVSDSQQDLEQAKTHLSEEETLAVDLWPFAVHDLLAGKNIGLVFLGDSSDQIDSLVRSGVAEAGGNVKAVVAVREPLDAAGIAAQATGYRYTALASDPSLTKEFGVRIGTQLVSGGQLLERVHTSLLSSYDGELGKLEGLVDRALRPGEHERTGRKEHERIQLRADRGCRRRGRAGRRSRAEKHRTVTDPLVQGGKSGERR